MFVMLGSFFGVGWVSWVEQFLLLLSGGWVVLLVSFSLRVKRLVSLYWVGAFYVSLMESLILAQDERWRRA
jgi:hypothetical protein